METDFRKDWPDYGQFEPCSLRIGLSQSKDRIEPDRRTEYNVD